MLHHWVGLPVKGCGHTGGTQADTIAGRFWGAEEGEIDSLRSTLHSFIRFTGSRRVHGQKLCAHMGFFFFCGRRRHHESFTGKSLHLARVCLCVYVCLSGLMRVQITSSDVVFSLGGSNLRLRAAEQNAIRPESVHERSRSPPQTTVCICVCAHSAGLGGRLYARRVSTSQFITNLLQMRLPPSAQRDVGGFNI